MHRLLTELPIERLASLVRELPDEVARALDGPIAAALHSRPSTAARRPETMRMKALRAYLVKGRDDALAGDILRSYFLGPRKDLVVAFLDATGTRHEDGQVEDDAEPEAGRVAEAVDTLVAGHGAEDVRLYLEVAAVQWPENEGIASALAARREESAAG